MGYDGFRKGLKKADVLNHHISRKVWFVVDKSPEENGYWVLDVVKHKQTKDGVWAIWEKTRNSKVVERWLGLILFEKVTGSVDVGWATKVVTEAEGPFYYDVPKAFLKESVTKKNDKWRKDVSKAQSEASRAQLRWNKIRKMLKDGDKIIFAEGIKEEFAYFRGFHKKMLLVEVPNAMTYRAGQRHIDVDKTLLELRKNV